MAPSPPPPTEADSVTESDNARETKPIEVHIEDVVYGGKGLARPEGMVCFVPGTLKGETVRVQITKQRRRYAEARLIDVVHAAPERQEPICPLALKAGMDAFCPGCAYQHVTYEEELRLKQAQLENLLTHQAGLDAPHFDEPVASPLPLHYRNKIVLHEQRQGDRWMLGYVTDNNRSLVDVATCPLAADTINEAIGALRREREKPGMRRERTTHTFRTTPHNGVVRFSGRASRDVPWLTETTAVGTLHVPPGAFFQVNPGLADKLVERIETFLAQDKHPNGRVIDLYCGVGLFAFGALRAGAAEVLGIDSHGGAIAAAQRNAKGLADGKPVHFFVSEAGPGLRHALAKVDPESVTLIVDPPRRGLDAAVLDVIAQTPPANLIYVSCAADTLARDLAAITKVGYHVETVQLFDMFPRTALFETLAVLRRGEGGGKSEAGNVKRET